MCVSQFKDMTEAYSFKLREDITSDFLETGDAPYVSRYEQKDGTMVYKTFISVVNIKKVRELAVYGNPYAVSFLENRKLD